MSDPGNIQIADYDYRLPEERIAQFPLAGRDGSKLLVCRRGAVSHDIFSNIDRYLAEDSLLVFNDTKVIRARLVFAKATGARIEIFCLEPVEPVTEIEAAFHRKPPVTWKCLVGNLKRWKEGPLMHECTHEGILHRLYAEYAGDCGDQSHLVRFMWEPGEWTFSEMLEMNGLVPLPPYIHRQTVVQDAERYQTIYAEHEGSVAAPTAGLHFTKPVLEKLAGKGILTEKVTLHVGVGTFKPVSAERITDHIMHHERIVVPKRTVEHLLNSPDKKIISVGTTSARTLESLYWAGVKLITGGQDQVPAVLQWDPYRIGEAERITAKQSLEALLAYLDRHKLEEYSGETQLMIVPGYRFRMLTGLITNFHMPKSTLLLLVAALVGGCWKEAYDYALARDFRFLSYGDSCLFFAPTY